MSLLCDGVQALIKFLFISPFFTTFVTHWERLSISRGRKKSWWNSQQNGRDKSYSSVWSVAMPTAKDSWISDSPHAMRETGVQR